MGGGLIIPTVRSPLAYTRWAQKCMGGPDPEEDRTRGWHPESRNRSRPAIGFLRGAAAAANARRVFTFCAIDVDLERARPLLFSVPTERPWFTGGRTASESPTAAAVRYAIRKFNARRRRALRYRRKCSFETYGQATLEIIIIVTFANNATTTPLLSLAGAHCYRGGRPSNRWLDRWRLKSDFRFIIPDAFGENRRTARERERMAGSETEI